MRARHASVFGDALRSWRRARRWSQLELAAQADVSARHLCFLETGRAQPSRQMVLILAEVLDLPLRERNSLLAAAGYASLYSESGLDAPELASVRRSIEFLLERHEPYPATVLNRHWNLLLANRAAGAVLSSFAPAEALAAEVNVIRLLLDPRMRPFVANWPEVASALIQRLHREAAFAASDTQAQSLLAEALATEGVPARWRTPDFGAEPSVLVPLRLVRDGLALDLFTAITTLGTAQDITLQELRMETYFPADARTERELRRLAQAPASR